MFNPFNFLKNKKEIIINVNQNFSNQIKKLNYDSEVKDSFDSLSLNEKIKIIRNIQIIILYLIMVFMLFTTYILIFLK